jgi:hypothetical protein
MDQKNCQTCKKLFYRRLAGKSREAKTVFLKKKFCSPSCASKRKKPWRKTGYNIVCEVCSKQFYVSKRKYEKEKSRFCSSNCYGETLKELVGEKNKNWKGLDVGYGYLHEWIRKNKQKKRRCEICNKQSKNLDAANISGKYARDTNDYMWLCRKCHNRYDAGWKYKNGFWHKRCTVCRQLKKLNENNFYFRKDKKVINPCILCHKKKYL